MKLLRFKKTVARYKDMIYSQAYYFTGNSEDAADITQDILVKLWTHFDSVSTRAMRSWLLTVTRNHCIDFARKKKEYLAMASANGDDDCETGYDTMIDRKPTPEDEAIIADTRLQIQNAIQVLPPQIRLTIILREIHNLSYEEISKTMGIPVNNVKVNLHRGRKKLHDLLKRFYIKGYVNELS